MHKNDKIDLAGVEMHAPVEVSLAAYIQMPDGRMGFLRATMPPGQLPSRADMKLVLDEMLATEAGEIPGAPKGSRPASRAEFVAHIVKRETGAPFQMQADAPYAPVPSDIPHQMLVHAVMGNDIADDKLANEYEARGLVKMVEAGGEYDWVWSESALAALPDDMLLAIYQRVTA